MGVIKASDATARRARIPAFHVLAADAAPAPAQAAIADAHRAELEGQVAALTEALEAAEAKLAALELDAEAREADAMEAGRAAGRLEGAAIADEALAILEASAAGAVDDLRESLRNVETLAVALAKAAVAKVFGEVGAPADRVSLIVRRQLAALERSAVLSVQVSTADFPDTEALAALQEAGGLGPVELQARDELGSGDCRIRLRLGELEVGVGQQWARLAALFDEALPGGAAG